MGMYKDSTAGDTASPGQKLLGECMENLQSANYASDDPPLGNEGNDLTGRHVRT